ncbi:fimbria/pilus periplasmic chaperone [Pantoea anthophila]|uniref:fimbria/pilus periplasmic chaperone n=1 Tax=Pantoea anthophila TaxID=470931 RepID=UPI0027836019|nr:fimbria/pilus periplasmic chaperone [Pantoea anthophila]MDQ1215036.1 P pilus assembly chaperone PapD [Pantoea anthophila]
MSRFLITCSSWKRFFLLLVIVFTPSAFSSVVMSGSRIIYPSDARSVDVQLRNNDSFPYVIQTWFDNGDEKSTPATGKAPFVATPSTFRISAKDGQVLRIFFVGGKTLPQDRESVFYFNFLQVPPANVGEDTGNKMVVMLKNRLKVFYRPASLEANPKKIFDYLTFSNISSSSVRITNTSPYYISLSKVSVRGAIAKDTPPMISPFSTVDVPLKQGKATGTPQGIEIGLVNDYGATVTYEYPI